MRRTPPWKSSRSGVLVLSCLALLGAANVAAAQEAPVIRALEVRGNEIYDDAYIFERLSSRVGQPLSPATVAADIERLFSEGGFENIEVLTEPYAEGVKLVFVVEERPTVDRISFVGVEELDADTVSETIAVYLKAGEPLDPAAVNEIVNAVEAQGEEAGLIRCEVTPEYTELDNGRVEVRFIVEEGSEIWIRSIDIEGNAAYSDWEIRNLFMELSEDEFWNASTLDLQTLEDDMAGIVDGYNAGGFINARVEDYELNFSEEGDEVDILVTIHEGERYYFGGITFEGHTILTENQIRRRMRLVPGDVLDLSAYDQSLADVKDDYWEFGYVFMDVDEQTEINEDSNRVVYHWIFDEGEPATVGELTIVGNTYTKDKVIRREFTVYPGEIFNGKAFRRSLERVFNLQYFENVIPEWDVDPETREIDLTVRVVEREGTTKISVGAAYSTQEGLMGTFSVSWINFDAAALPAFWKAKGGGQSVTLEAEIGGSSDNYRFSFLEPWFLDTETAVGAGVYTSSLRSVFRYEKRTFGFYGLVGRPLGDDANWRLRYDYSETNLDPFDDAGESVQDAAGSYVTSAVQLSLNHDTRNNYFFPSSGSRQFLSFEVGGGYLGGDVDYYKITGYTTAYFPSFWKFALAARVRASYVAPYGDTDSVPVYERFYVGGNDVRGHQDYDLSPRDENDRLLGGTFEFYYNLEYRFPISERFVFGFLFFDSGYCWEKISAIDLADLGYGFGLGVRIDVPMVGLMGFDYGWSPELPEGRLHFSIENTF